MKFSFFRSILAIIMNKHSDEAYKRTEELDLYMRLLIAGVSKPFSRNEQGQLKEIGPLIEKVDPIFVAKLLIYLREVLQLRCIPLATLALWSKSYQGGSLLSETTARILQKPNDIGELLTYYQTLNSRKEEKKLHKLSKQIQKGIALAFTKFEEHHYIQSGEKHSVTLKDALLLTHPKVKDARQKEIFNKIAREKLPQKPFWKEEFSNFALQNFSSQKTKREALKLLWEKLIFSEHLTFLDLLRNLQDIAKAEVSTIAINKIASRITDPVEIDKSGRLPFFFLSEWRKAAKWSKYKSATILLDALEKAIQISGENIRGFVPTDRVLLAMDVSEPMYQTIGKKNHLRYLDIGKTLSEALKKRLKEFHTLIFGDSDTEVPQKSTIAIIESLTNRKQVMDKILIFSAVEDWDSSPEKSALENAWNHYKKRIAPTARLYFFDLMEYRKNPLTLLEPDVYWIAGWSERIFEMLAGIEDGENALVQINTINP